MSAEQRDFRKADGRASSARTPDISPKCLIRNLKNCACLSERSGLPGAQICPDYTRHPSVLGEFVREIPQAFRAPKAPGPALQRSLILKIFLPRSWGRNVRIGSGRSHPGLLFVRDMAPGIRKFWRDFVRIAPGIGPSETPFLSGLGLRHLGEMSGVLECRGAVHPPRVGVTDCVLHTA